MQKFIPPNEKERLDAIGLIKSGDSVYAWKTMRKSGMLTFPPIKYFIPDVFLPIPMPKEDDWLAEHKVAGQTFSRFSTCRRLQPRPGRNVIYLQPLQFHQDQSLSEITLNTLCEYASIFFGLPVQLKKPIKDLDGSGLLKSVTRRMNTYTEEPQAHASKILSVLKLMKPGDAFCVSGITLCDIYPRESWNYVFGLASTKSGTGVYSLCRYLPESVDRPLIVRAVRVMCHEICHMFGMRHCKFFACLMNGANHAEEAITRPTFMCPSCLRKLHYSAGFNLEQRYRKMLTFWECIISEAGELPSIVLEDIEWLKTRISL